MHLCVEFFFFFRFLPMIEYVVQRVGVCIAISVHTIRKNNPTGFKQTIKNDPV